MRGVIQQRQRLVREGVALWVDAQPDLELVACLASPAELLALIADLTTQLDFVVFELDGDDETAVDLVPTLRARLPAARLVGVVTQGRAADARVASAGLSAVVPGDHGVTEILAAIRGEAQVPVETVAPGAVLRTEIPSVLLSDRELEVLHLVGEGLPAREIAARLRISPKTVDNHKQRIYAKLGVQSQAHAVAVATRAGLIAATSALATGASLADGGITSVGEEEVDS